MTAPTTHFQTHHQTVLYSTLALLNYRCSQFEEAYRICDEAIRKTVYRTSDEEVTLKIYRAETGLIKGIPKKQLLEQLLEIDDESASVLSRIQLANTAGLIYLEMPSKDDARERFRTALELSKVLARSSSPRDRNIARVFVSQAENNLGRTYLDDELYEVSLAYFRRSLRKKRNLGHALGQISSMQNIALATLHLGRLRSYRYWDNKSMELATQFRAWKSLVNHLLNTADVFLGHGDIDEAQGRIERAAEVLDTQIVGWESARERIQRLSKALLSHK